MNTSRSSFMYSDLAKQVVNLMFNNNRHKIEALTIVAAEYDLDTEQCWILQKSVQFMLGVK